MAMELGLERIEKDLQPYDVVNANAATLASMPYCVDPCTRITTTPVVKGIPGPVWRRLIEAWSKLMGMDVLAQILNSSVPAPGM